MHNPSNERRVSIGAKNNWVEMTKVSDVPIRSYQVLGERSSGTNYVDQLLARNLTIKPVNLFQWKHGYPATHFIPRSALVLVCFRDPIDWLASMHRKPWHTPAHFWNMPFSEFLRIPWETRVDDWVIRDDLRELRRLEHPARYLTARFWNHFVRARFPIHRGWVKVSQRVKDSAFGLPLQHDRDPVDGSIFENILRLRNAKMRGFLSLRNRECNYVFARFEVVRADPEGFINAVSSQFGLERKGPFKPVEEWLGTLPHGQQAQAAVSDGVLSAEDLGFILSELDCDFEHQVGYLGSAD